MIFTRSNKPPLFLAAQVVCIVVAGVFMSPPATSAQVILPNPIVFVTRPEFPQDFGTINAVISNHGSTPQTSGRGGDLYIRYTNGTLKNLTQAAGYGGSGLVTTNGIQVRDPAVYWDGNKVIFSMIVGAPAHQYDYSYQTTERWQLYEITGLTQGETPVITKVANQPASYNNIMPEYGTDDRIIFVSDRPRDGQAHLYPQRDEYESAETNTGVWSLDSTTGGLKLLDHSPSGDFKPRIDSFGRVIFSRWDHLQRDQQRDAGNYGTFDYSSESSSSVPTSGNSDIFPEPRDVDDVDYSSRLMLHTLNHFFPWQCNEDGTELEIVNHAGRHELTGYKTQSFTDDSNLVEMTSSDHLHNTNYFTNFIHVREDPTVPGTFYGVDAQEFATHAAGQIVSLNGAPSVNPDDMEVTYITHPDTKSESNSPSVNHSGLYRDPLVLSDGTLIAVHTAETRADSNQGTTAQPDSRYDFRLKTLKKVGSYWVPDQTLTSGINKSVSYWDPDTLVSYSNKTMWEMEPVELKAKSRPARRTAQIPALERGVIDELTSLAELRAYLEDNGLALVISRNMTTRDRNDRLQPFNLKVAGSNTQTIGALGKIYPIAFMQFFQGDLIRGMYGYGQTSGTPEDGRRILARTMHDTSVTNPPLTGAPDGSVEIGTDGSMAAFVPARRALTWQMTDTTGDPVVRERFWVTFQPGEIRVCTSCHGVNTADQANNPAPTNEPAALRSLLDFWKGIPHEAPKWNLKLKGGAAGVSANKKITVNIKGKNSAAANRELSLMLKIGSYSCPTALELFTVDSNGDATISGKLPLIKSKTSLILDYRGATVDKLSLSLGNTKPSDKSAKALCKKAVKALKKT